MNPSPVPSRPVPSLPDVAGARPPDGGAARAEFDRLMAANGIHPEIAGRGKAS